ncbi:ubiquitin-conjugating enzyme/RWD-like protein [Phyllosticta paracitricarpa]|uniref:Ubiquitin-conjugating enzyme E2 2 n=3 Tax=Phyllosticta TaxID=121621 RepID=A0ABR1N5K5_9PEZI
MALSFAMSDIVLPWPTLPSLRQEIHPEARMASSTAAAAGLLGRQLKQMQTDKDIPGISVGLVDNNVFEWEVMLMISDDCKFYGGGFFRARLSFPTEYPLLPPKMKFETPIFHPNIYPSGEVCISILHPPGDDKYGYESASERWSPVQTPETILLSVISMLSSPNDESPANVEAGRLWREDPKEFKKRVRKCVRDSLEEGM